MTAIQLCLVLMIHSNPLKYCVSCLLDFCQGYLAVFAFVTWLIILQTLEIHRDTVKKTYVLFKMIA